MIWDWDFAAEILPLLAKATIVTIEATLLGTALAMVLGLILAILGRAPSVIVRGAVRSVVEFIRSTPLLVQLYFVWVLAPNEIPLLAIGVVVLGVHYATYTAEVYRAGIDGVPKGQWEASTALNLPRGHTWRAVILPQAIRRVIPALGNYLVSMFKETPLLSAIGILELVGEAQALADQKFRAVEPYTMAGLIFLVLSIPSAYFVRWLEVRFGRA
ncbi:MAG: ectoine/hydroxyectoine ABC transporter permease subunit EhuD [Micromonosporaceae bacterium]